MATKRAVEGENTEPDQKKPRTEDGVELELVRVLVDNAEASVIIGKGGANVKRIREESSAFVSILKAEGGKERVMEVKGSLQYNTKAMKLINELIFNAAKEKKGEGEEASPLTVKLLVHKALAGAIIGRGGEIIRTMQSETGARISLSTEPLGSSTEKSVTVTGALEQVNTAVEKVLAQISENPLKPGASSVPYVPGAAAPVGFGFPPESAYGMPPQGYGMPPQGYGAPPQGYGAPPQPFAAAPGAQKTEKIVIPTICAGTVIGKGGTIIRDIKTQSGTQISLANPEPTAPDDRVVSITGTAQGIQTAIYLIRQRVESYQAPAV